MPGEEDDDLDPVLPPPVPGALPAAEPPVVPSRRYPDARRSEVPLVGTPEHDAMSSTIRERERKKALRDAWGTDDPSEIDRLKAKRAEAEAAAQRNNEELERLRTERAEQDRAKMSETERLTNDLTALKKECDELKAKLQLKENEVLTERQNSLIQQAAIRHKIKGKPSILRVVLQDYAAAYYGLSSLEKRRLTDKRQAEKHLERFMRKWAEENQDMCDTSAVTTKEKEPSATTPPRPAAQPIRRPLGQARIPSNSSGRQVPTSPLMPGMDANGKTVKPGQPNSMTKAELEAYKRANRLKTG